MDVIFDWNLDNMIYNGLITLRLYGFPFAEVRSFHPGRGLDPAIQDHLLWDSRYGNSTSSFDLVIDFVDL